MTGGECIVRDYSRDSGIPDISHRAETAEIADLLNNYLKENQKIKITDFTHSAKVKNKKKLSYKRAEELYELMIFYGFRKDIEAKLSGRGEKKQRH